MAANEVYGIGDEGRCWKYNGSSWIQISDTPALKRISCTKDSTKVLCALKTDGTLVEWSGTAWEDRGGISAELAAYSVNEVWTIGANGGGLWIWEGNVPIIGGFQNIWTYVEEWYAKNVALTFTLTDGATRQLVLCNKLMRSDSFEIDRFGNVEHSYDTDFDLSFSDLQTDLGRMPNLSPHTAYCSISDSKSQLSDDNGTYSYFHSMARLTHQRRKTIS